MRIMYDSVVPAEIPATAEAVAGYINGKYAWKPADWARFEHSTRIRIDVDGSQPWLSDVIDVERGDATPARAAAWCKQRQHVHGWWSAVYVDDSNWASVIEACKAAGATQVVYWVAQWTGHAHLVSGSVATQFISTAHYDASLISDHWFPHSAPGWSVP